MGQQENRGYGDTPKTGQPLPTREELIKAGYPYGKAAEGIPLGDPAEEWRRSEPDIVVFRPPSDSYQGDNEHFLAFTTPTYNGYLALWTQSSCEGAGDDHLVFSRSSPDGSNWEAPRVIAGYTPDGRGELAACGFPIVSKSGRIYVFYIKAPPQREIEGYGTVERLAGDVGCLYSDDNGATWISSAAVLPVRRHKRDHPDPRVPASCIIWQMPVADGKGRYLAGYTHTVDRTMRPEYDAGANWMNADSRCFFMRFDNIDDDPEPGDIKMTWLPDDEDGIAVPNPYFAGMSTAQEPAVVVLPDGRLLAVMRTAAGSIWYSTSEDEGHHWCTAAPLLYHDDGEEVPHPISPCPLYRLEDGRYLLLYHNNDGRRLGFDMHDLHWTDNYANYFRNPTYYSVGTFCPQARQPLRFSPPVLFADSGDIAVGPKRTTEMATYTSLTARGGDTIVWYPDRKYYLLGKRLRGMRGEAGRLPQGSYR